MTFNYPDLDALFLDPSTNAPAIARLGGGTVRRDAQGYPVRTSGRHTVVYELRTPSGRMLALRIHQRTDAQRDRILAQRFIALQQDHLLDPLRAPHGPLPAEIGWLPDGLLVREADGRQVARPAVVMERVPGRTLREMVMRLCQEGDGAHLALIADRWLETALAMETAGFVHGDLGPDNIMVRPDGSIAVIYLDTATWPSFHPEHDLAGSNSALRHPQGLPRNQVYRDRFPALMLWAALRILATQPELLQGPPADGLLFSSADVRRTSASAVFARLDEAGASLQLLLEVVRRAIRFSPEDLPPLSEIAARLDGLGFPRIAPRDTGRPTPDVRVKAAEPTITPATAIPPVPVLPIPAPSGGGRQTPSRPEAADRPSIQTDSLDALHAAIQQRNGREALRIW